MSSSHRSGSKDNGGRNDNDGRWGNEGKGNEGTLKGWESHPGYGDESWGRGGGTGGSGGSSVRKRLNTNTNPPVNQNQKTTRVGRSNEGVGASLAVSIVNATGKKLFFPPGLSQTYCANFLDTGESCRFGYKCNFKHCKFPKDFPSDDIASMMTLVSKTRGLSWNPVLRLPGGIRE